MTRPTIRCWGCTEPARALILQELPGIGVFWEPFCAHGAAMAVKAARALKQIRRRADEPTVHMRPRRRRPS